MSRGASIGVGVVIVAALFVLVGPGFGGAPDPSDFSPEYLAGAATIDVVFTDASSGTYAADAIAICEEGTVTRLGSGTATGMSWSEDEYRCGAGSFVVRIELPDRAEVDVSGPTDGTWTIHSGADDYTLLSGEGTVTVTLEPHPTMSLVGTIDSGY